MASVAVLLATYNGERYVGELLESLFAQSCTDWHLIVSDDGSQDATPDILQRFLGRYPDRMTLLPPHAATGSSKENFLYLTEEAAGYDYYMYCDQDDVWLPEKIGLTLDKMKETEAGQADVPCLVHTDLEVTDAEGNAADSVLRVLMVWKPVDEHTDIEPQTFSGFERNGFTVVEWGGAEVDD